MPPQDPSFRYSRDEESNQTVIEGMGPLDRSKEWFVCAIGVGLCVSQNQVDIGRAIEDPKPHTPHVLDPPA